MIPHTTLAAGTFIFSFLFSSYMFCLDKDFVRSIRPQVNEFIVFNKALIRKYNAMEITVAVFNNNTANHNITMYLIEKNGLYSTKAIPNRLISSPTSVFRRITGLPEHSDTDFCLFIFLYFCIYHFSFHWMWSTSNLVKIPAIRLKKKTFFVCSFSLIV